MQSSTDPLVSDAVAARDARRVRVARLAWLAGVLGVVLIAADQISRERAFRVDDAYITFSFSKNLGTGHGPVFSHGLRVEGYSNFLWMLVIALFYVASPQGDPSAYARFIAFVCVGVTLVSSYRLARRGARPLLAWTAPLLVVCCSDLFRAAASALETTAYVAAISVGWVAYLSEDPSRRRWSLLAFVPAALLRIDGFVPLLIVCGVELATRLAERRWSALELARWMAPACALWGAYFAWRYAYYGLPLPAPYYAKQLVTTGDPQRGIRQVWEMLRDYGLWACLPLLALPLLRGPRREAASLLAATVLLLAYAAKVGGDWMPFHRFLLPVVPLVAVVFAYGLEQAWLLAGKLRREPRWAARTGAVLIWGFCAEHLHSRIIDTRVEREKIRLARAVRRHTVDNLLAVKDLMAYVVRRPGDRLLTDYAGVFSVFTDAQVIDVWGLCNVDVALHGDTRDINPIYGKACPRCYARARPDYLHVGTPMLRPTDAFPDVSSLIAEIFHGPALQRLLRLHQRFAVGRVVVEAKGQALWFLERRRPELPLEIRRPARGIRVDYPFERAERPSEPGLERP
jgi:hypothetical protein